MVPKAGPPPRHPATPGEILRCSFCNKSQADVKQLIAGPDVYICDECVDICLDILATGPVMEHDLPAVDPSVKPDPCWGCGRATVPLDLPEGKIVCVSCLAAMRLPDRSS